MSVLKLCKIANISKLCVGNKQILTTAVRHHWNDDYKPGPYPLTEKERNAAAEKYGLHPADYEPYPDDGTGYGDYPKMPMESADSRDPFYPWDSPELKRNFDEPLHVQFDLIREDRYDVNAKYSPSMLVQYLQFIGIMVGCTAIILACEHVKMFHATVPKQYPKDGQKHYTFESSS